MKRDECIRRNFDLLAILRSHKGAERAIKKSEIDREMRERGWCYSDYAVLINAIMREYNAPICYSKNGYFWAGNASEINATICDLEGRIEAMREHINILKNFIF